MMVELSGWRQVFLTLCGGDVGVAHRVGLLRSMLDDEAGTMDERLAPLSLVADLPPEARLLLLPGVAARLGDLSASVRRLALDTLFQCVEAERLRPPLRDAVRALADRGDDRARALLRGVIAPICQSEPAPSELSATGVLAETLAAISLLVPATAGEGNSGQAALRPSMLEGRLNGGHLLIREATVRWLGSSGAERRVARELLRHAYEVDPDPMIAAQALLAWAHRSPAADRRDDLLLVLSERRYLRLWGGPRDGAIPLTTRQQLEIVGGALVLALLPLASGDTSLVEIVLGELEAPPLPWGVAPDGVPRRFDLERGVPGARERNERIVRLLGNLPGPPCWLRGVRSGPSEFDVGLASLVYSPGARGDDLWFASVAGRWLIRGPVHPGERGAVDLSQRFVLGPMDAPLDAPRREVESRLQCETEDRGWWLLCACDVVAGLLSTAGARITADQRARLQSLIVAHGASAHRIPPPRHEGGGEAHPIRRLRDRFTLLALRRLTPCPEAFAERTGDLALTRLCAAALRSVPGTPAYAWIHRCEDRLMAIAQRSPVAAARVLAAFVVAVHRRSPAVPPGVVPLRVGDLTDTTAEGVLFLSNEDLDGLVPRSPRLRVFAAVELAARGISDSARAVPETILPFLRSISQPMLPGGVSDDEADAQYWSQNVERLTLRLLLAWAVSPSQPSPEVRPLLLHILRDAPTAAVDLLIRSWNPSKEPWTVDRELLGRLVWRLTGPVGLRRHGQIDRTAVQDALARQLHLRSLLQEVPNAGRMTPTWLEARLRDTRPQAVAASARLQVVEHGPEVWRVTGPDAPAFVHRTPGAIELTCVARGGAGLSRRPLFGRDDVLVAMLPDADHPRGRIRTLKFVMAQGAVGVFRFHALQPLAVIHGLDIEVFPGELLGPDGRPCDMRGLPVGRVLEVSPAPRLGDIVLKCIRFDDSIPILRRTFARGQHLTIVRKSLGWRFAVNSDRDVPSPAPDGALAGELEGIPVGSSRIVCLGSSWDPETAPGALLVTSAMGSRSFRGAETPETLAQLLSLEVGDEIAGVLERNGNNWSLDGLPIRLTPGAEHFGPRGSGPLAPPLIVVQIDPGVAIGSLTDSDPVRGLIVGRHGNTAHVRTLANGRSGGLDEFELSGLDLDIGDRVSVDPEGTVWRHRLDILASPSLEEAGLDPEGFSEVRTLRFLSTVGSDWILAVDGHRVVRVPAPATAPPSPLADVEARATAAGIEFLPLSGERGPAPAGARVEVARVCGRLVAWLEVAPVIDLVPALALPALDGLLPCQVDARLSRRDRAWKVEPSGVRSPPLEMAHDEFSWDPLRRWDRANWRGPVWIWRDGSRVTASVRRVPPLSLGAWASAKGIWGIGSRPLIYAGKVPAEQAVAWGLPPFPHHLLEHLPGTHIALQGDELRFQSLAPGDRILRYRVLPRRGDIPIRLLVLAVEVSFASRLERFGAEGGIVAAELVNGRVLNVTDEEGVEHEAPAGVFELSGSVPSGDRSVYLRFEGRDGHQLTFSVVPSGQVMRSGTLLVVEVMATLGTGHRARLRVRPAGPGPEGEVHANDYSVDRLRLGAVRPAPGTRMLARVLETLPDGRGRLSCTAVPLRPFDAVMREAGEIEVTVCDRPSSAGTRVEVCPGFRIEIPRFLLDIGNFVQPGDRLVLDCDPSGYRLSLVDRVPGPWEELHPGTMLFVLPWGSPERRIQAWERDGWIEGHVVGVTAALVRLHMLPRNQVAGVVPLPAVLLPSDGPVRDARFAPEHGEWAAWRLGLVDAMDAPDRDRRWRLVTAREAESGQALSKAFRDTRWRAEPGGPELGVAEGGLFLRHGIPTSLLFGPDHVLEQFQSPDGGNDARREFIVAEVDAQGLIVEVHPRRLGRIPWRTLVSAGAWPPGLSWDSGAFARGDKVSLGIRPGGQFALLSHEVGCIRRLTGTVAPLEVGHDGVTIGPRGLRVLAELLGPLPPGAGLVRVQHDGLVPCHTPMPGDTVFLVDSPRGLVVYGAPALRWFWRPEDGDSLSSEQDLVRVVHSLGAVACTIVERMYDQLLLDRSGQTRPLLSLPAGRVCTARMIEPVDSRRILAEIRGIPWIIEREMWCQGPVNLMEVGVRRLLRDPTLSEICRGEDGKFSLLATRPAICGEVDAEVVAHANGLVVRAAGRIAYVSHAHLGWAELSGAVVAQLHPLGSSIRLAPDSTGRLGVDEVGAIRQDLEWLRRRGGPVLVQPLPIELGDGRTQHYGRLASGLIVGVARELRGPSAGWVVSIQTARRRLMLDDEAMTHRWDLPALESGEGLVAALTSGRVTAERKLGLLDEAVHAARHGDPDRANDLVRRVWALVRTQAHRTLLLPHPRHLMRGAPAQMLAFVDGLEALPPGPVGRVAALGRLCGPATHSFDSGSQSVRCWLAVLLGVGADAALDALQLQIQEDLWDGRRIPAGAWVTLAALSFARGDCEDGLSALLAWDGLGDGSDPWVEAGRFWRGWLRGDQRDQGGEQSFLHALERLAACEASAAEIGDLATLWTRSGRHWILDDVEIAQARSE